MHDSNEFPFGSPSLILSAEASPLSLEAQDRSPSKDEASANNQDSEQIFGTPRNDTIEGDAGSDTIFAGQGADVLFGVGGDDKLVGDMGADTLKGGTGKDFLAGGSGADFLRGGLGKDEMHGGSGKDRFFLEPVDAATNHDTILDFARDKDVIILSFKKDPAPAPITSDNFEANNKGDAVDAADRILYGTQNGKLYYDPDGSGAREKVLIAIIGENNHPTLKHTDFHVESIS